MGGGCTPSELIEASKPDSHITCLDRSLTAAILALALCPISSFIAIVWFFGTICVNVIKRRAAHARDPTVEYRLIRFPIELYLLSMFAGDFFQSLGLGLTLRWVIEGKAYIDDYCKAAGFILTIGETAVAMSTIAIAVHTFISVWYNKVLRSFLIPYMVVGVAWSFDILFSFILFVSNHERRHALFAPSPYWCWMNSDSKYLPWKIVGFYGWLWLGIVVSILCYVPLFLWRLGFITVARKPWWKFKVHRRLPGVTPTALTRSSYAMILYPLVYFILGTPVSITRWLFFVWQPEGRSLSPIAIILGSAIFNLSGLCNVLLFLYTRQGLLLFSGRNREAAGGQTLRSPTLGIVENGGTDDSVSRFGNDGIKLSQSEQEASIQEEGRE